ncbi:MAG: tetratricopeptide repeat protein [Planctomycetota bacterium]
MAAATVCGTAGADTVVVGGITWSDVQVRDFSGGKLHMYVGRREVVKPLDAIRRITLDGRDAFNQAERQRSDKPEKAAELYQRAADGARDEWLRRLIAWRRLDALGRAGRIVQWTRVWTRLLREADELEAAAKLRPETLGTPERNARAAEHLESVLDDVENEQVASGIRVMLLTLKRAATAEPAEAPDGEPTVETGDMDVSVRVGADRQSRRLRELERMVTSESPAEAIRAADSALTSVSSGELPRVLYLGGMARLKAVEAGAEHRAKLLRRAGLLFMKLAVFHPTHDDTPEALLRAGTISERLGDLAGAQAAYQLVLARYGRSDAAQTARERLSGLQARPGGTPGEAGSDATTE